VAGRGAGKSRVLSLLAETAVASGLSLAELAELDFDGLDEVRRVAAAERQRLEWTNDTELLAGILEQLRALTAVVQSGVQTKSVRSLRTPRQPKPIKRPDWVAEAADPVVVVGPGDLFQMMKGGPT